MSEKERLHKAIFEMVKQGRLTLEKAANQVGLSYRQAKRIYKRYKVEGGAGLMHKLRGRESNRKHPEVKCRSVRKTKIVMMTVPT